MLLKNFGDVSCLKHGGGSQTFVTYEDYDGGIVLKVVDDVGLMCGDVC